MQDVLHGLVWVALGSALGGPTRYFVSGLIGRHIGETFPWGTMVVNVTGAFVIGVIASVAAGGLHTTSIGLLFTAVGFVGSYTTVSSFSLQTLALARDGAIAMAGGNVLLSLFFCLSAVALGYAVGSAALGAGLS